MKRTRPQPAFSLWEETGTQAELFMRRSKFPDGGERRDGDAGLWEHGWGRGSHLIQPGWRRGRHSMSKGEEGKKICLLLWGDKVRTVEYCVPGGALSWGESGGRVGKGLSCNPAKVLGSEPANRQI